MNIFQRINLDNIVRSKEDLNTKSLSIKQWLKISTSEKEFLVIIRDKLYFVKDQKNLQRLIFERLPYEIAFNVEIYSLKY